MFVTVINDCRDADAMSRQTTRLSALFGVGATACGVVNDLEAAGNLVDALDASLGEEGVICVNVAPRHGTAKKWPNGTPFGAFRVGKTLVVTSVDGRTLSLVKKLGLAEKLDLYDIPTVMPWAAEKGLVSADDAERIVSTQFRSFEFVPRVAKWAWDGLDVPHGEFNVADVADAPDAIWWTDNFGNCKTTILEEEHPEGELTVGAHTAHRRERLKDVPDDEFATIVGSSGIGQRRFLEIVLQGGSAAKGLGVASGDAVRR